MARKDDDSQPVYFLDLIVENVRCFGKKQVLDLSDGKGKPALWTVILGNNGTGKTTLLQCLAILNPISLDSQDIDTLRSLVNLEQRWIESVQRNKVNILISTNVLLSDCKQGVNKKNGEIITFTQHGTPENIHRLHNGNFSKLNGFTCYGYGAARRMGTVSFESKPLSHRLLYDNNIDSLFNDNADLFNVKEWLLQLDYSASKSSDMKAKFEFCLAKVKEILIKVLPDVKDIEISTPTEEQPIPLLRFKTDYGWVSMDQLSLGYKTMIAWIADLSRRLIERYPDSPNPIAEPAIVLIDEIDLHLHPKWQRELMNFLSERFVKTQFIVTAHSPLIVQSAQNANIVLLKREGDEVIIHNNKDEDIIKGWRLDQVVTSDLFDLPTARPQEYDEILRERKRILAKPKLTAKDKKRLEQIGRKLDELPVAEKKEDNEAMEIIRKAAQILKGKVK